MTLRLRVFVLVGLSLAGGFPLQAETVLRVGMFPNVTHAQALIARNLSREGKGWFEPRLGGDVRIEWFTFNAGPSAMEAFFAKSVELTYVGPSPVVNAFVRANGQTVRVVSGSLRGGSALVTRLPEIQSPEDWRGKTIATPQLGNTQDVDCRAWLIHHGIRVTLVGGDARVIPTPNAEMMDLFRSGKIDGAWTVEPWVSRLILDGGGRIFKEEPEEPTTVLAVREDYLAAQPEMVKRFVAAHRELTEWIVQNPEEAKRRVKEELEAITRSKMNPAVIDAAWTRMHFDSSISAEPFEIFLAKARAVGFLRAEFSLKNLVVDLP